ncbi:response regulator transcription factor [Enterococcus sp. CWB-B31]|uniref:response regulator transcription factor n=1 Tax=Enterococcus sp. CWB-B31 TaxID=2885159 RepID=UPI001E487DD0|nr:response regulator transcription factor [Enterococcus sp. CWB-B31]MCB5953537.1 response regulator transcription factor [Enterococcus sp. CWB-B31]
MQKILIIEDNHQIVDVLEKYLQKEGYETKHIYDGKEALDLFPTEPADLILLDIMLPNVDGFTICKKIRRTSIVPIIMITAKSEDADRILGLEIGADDYIVKPFSPKEVVARIKALLRRIDFEKNTVDSALFYGNIFIDQKTKEIKIGHSKVILTKKEFELLILFLQYPKKVFTRENLLDSAWGIDYYGDPRTVDSHIKRLRVKLKTAGSSCKIKTIWGEGYALEVME